MNWTQEPPTKPGYYWWTNFGEHTPTILKVGRSQGKLYADNGEYCFKVSKNKAKPFDDIKGEEKEEMSTTIGGKKFYYGEEL